MANKLNGAVYRTLIEFDTKTVRGKPVETRNAIARAERVDGKRKEFCVKVDARGEEHAQVEATRQAEEWIGWIDAP